jgi:signal transduction histidine kinase
MHASAFVHDGERYVTVAHFDVTRRRLSEEGTERRNRALSEFAHAVSHDLRNPLTVAMGNLAMERDEGDTELLRKTADALERIDELIGGLLERAESGDTAKETSEVVVADVSRDAWGNVATGDATFDVEGDEDLVVEADRGQLLRVFENLFRNAVEHGGEGVAVRLGATDGGFYVEDDGRGIDDGVLPDVFETGMGLKTARDVAEAHGWEVTVEESDEGGARFVFDVRPASPTTTY